MFSSTRCQFRECMLTDTEAERKRRSKVGAMEGEGQRKNNGGGRQPELSKFNAWYSLKDKGVNPGEPQHAWVRAWKKAHSWHQGGNTNICAHEAPLHPQAVLPKWLSWLCLEPHNTSHEPSPGSWNFSPTWVESFAGHPGIPGQRLTPAQPQQTAFEPGQHALSRPRATVTRHGAHLSVYNCIPQWPVTVPFHLRDLNLDKVKYSKIFLKTWLIRR